MTHPQDTEVHVRVLVDLIASREKAVADWIKFLATVQAGLAIGFGVLLIQQKSPALEGVLGKLLTVTIPLFAILIAIGTQWIVWRERVWQHWFNFKLQSLTGTAIFPDEYFSSKYRDKRTPQKPSDINPGRITRVLTIMTGTLVLVWLTVGGFAFVYY